MTTDAEQNRAVAQMVEILDGLSDPRARAEALLLTIARHAPHDGGATLRAFTDGWERAQRVGDAVRSPRTKA